MSRRSTALAATAVVAVLLVTVLVADEFGFLPRFGTSSPPAGAPPFSNQSYTSSVDGTTLFYNEWVPASYTPGVGRPFLLFLHGQAEPTDPGCGELSTRPSGIDTINAALASGYLVGSLCTRTGDGWYVNSPFSGPQESDVLDAIAHEKAIRTVTSVYLLGFSMGTVGSLSMAEHHPSLFAGVGLVEPCGDFFQIIAYLLSSNQAGALVGYQTTTGGTFPSAGGYALAQTYYLSAFRYFPQNLTGMKLYVVDGGADPRCPNNSAVWPFQQGNDTLLTSSCVVAASQRQPAGCTTPFATLPGAHLRFVYESRGTHNLDNLNGPDLIGYFDGNQPDGTYWAVPGGVPSPPPA